MKNEISIEHITRQFVELYNPVKLLLFGSRAKGKANVHSDIDL